MTCPHPKQKLRVLDLFSGIGGFSLGLERTGGFETVAFCEIEEYPRKVLARHWPKVPCYDDVRNLTADVLGRDRIAVDVICGGFPCQDISFAGKGAGLAGERSGLWFHYARLIGELRPKFVIVENVAALLSRGLADVLGSLAALGYDAEWHCIPASAVGAPHRRDRLWIVAYARGKQHESGSTEIGRALASQLFNSDAVSIGWREDEFHEPCETGIGAQTRQPSRLCEDLADAKSERRGEARQLRCDEPAQRSRRRRQKMADTECKGLEGLDCRQLAGGSREGISNDAWQSGSHGRSQWFVEPSIRRVAHGVPARVDRLRGLGNAVVPQVVTVIGQAILKSKGLA